MGTLFLTSTLMSPQTYLHSIGLAKKEIQLYLALAEINAQPASIVAKHCNMDRITAYKNLKKLCTRGILKTYYRDGIQCFGIERIDAIKDLLIEEKEKKASLLEEFGSFKTLLEQNTKEYAEPPRTEVFEGTSGIKRMFRDILYEIKHNELKQLRMLTTNTFDEKIGNTSLGDYISEFFEDIQKMKIHIEAFEATGTLIPERIQKSSFVDRDISSLPAARGTTNIFIAGHTVYLSSFKKNAIGLKIKQQEMSQIFHFLFDTFS